MKSSKIASQVNKYNLYNELTSTSVACLPAELCILELLAAIFG